MHFIAYVQICHELLIAMAGTRSLWFAISIDELQKCAFLLGDALRDGKRYRVTSR